MSSVGRPGLSPARYRKGAPFSVASTQGLWRRVGCVGDISARPPAWGKRVGSHSVFGKQSKSLSRAGAGMHVCPPGCCQVTWLQPCVIPLGRGLDGGRGRVSLRTCCLCSSSRLSSRHVPGRSPARTLSARRPSPAFWICHVGDSAWSPTRRPGSAVDSGKPWPSGLFCDNAALELDLNFNKQGASGWLSR